MMASPAPSEVEGSTFRFNLSHFSRPVPSASLGTRLCSATLILVSLFRPHKHTAESERLVWSDPRDAFRGEAWKGIGNYRFLAALLFATMVVLYTIFA